MSDREFREYGIAAMIGACSGVGDVLAGQFSGHMSGLSVIITSALAAMLAVKTFKVRRDRET